MKKILILSAVLILMGAGCNTENTKQEEMAEIISMQSLERVEAQESAIKEMLIEESLLAKLKKDLNTQTVNLPAVDGSDSFGTAYRLVGGDMNLEHVVTASLPDLPVGVSYEGWLVQSSPLKFFSTGVMTKSEDDLWILEYKADEAFPTYLTVVITRETKVDAIPEKHIIEASF